MTDVKTVMNGLDLFEGGERNASLTFSINLFTDVLLTEVPAATLRCQELFLQNCPKDAIKFYATENMRKHRAVNKKVFTMLQTWMNEPSGKPDYVVLELKDGELAEDAPKYFFKVVSCEEESVGRKDGLANMVSLAFPPEVALDRTEEMFQVVLDLCAEFPFQSGSAGFAFHCSRYSTQEGESHAWRSSMRYPEIDIVRVPQDIHAVRQNAIKTVNWLTIVSEGFIESLGGIKAIEKRLGINTTVVRVKRGYVFRIGDEPALSDRNRHERLTDYAKLYAVLKPLIETASEQSQWFDTGGQDEDDQTKSWYRRFDQ